MGCLRKNHFLFFLTLTLSILSGSTFATRDYSTILTAQQTDETINIDGLANESVWANAKNLIVQVQDGSIGTVEVLLKALYDGDYIYLHVTWDDPTESIEKMLWTFNGSEWTVSGNEDRFSFIWNIDDSIRRFDVGGCAILCHGDRMHTNALDERGDIWHWKASRSNPLQAMDDEWMDNTIIGEYSHDALEAAHKDDLGGGIYIRNINERGDGPMYIESSPGDHEDARFLYTWEIENGEAVLVDNITVKNGSTAPGYILKGPTGSRADIEAKGVWQEGEWSLEIKRKLNTGHDDDVQFDVTKTYRFGVAIMDNTGGFSGFGKGHSFDLGARTLEFGGMGSEAVTQLSLINGYLTTARKYVEQNNPGLAISTVDDAAVLYNPIGGEVASLDPSLHISIITGFRDARRQPMIGNINDLSNKINDAILTFQGKRKPPEPTLGLIILSVWGRVQHYVFVSLSIIVLYPLYRTIKTSLSKELRYFGLFLFIVILPIFLHGLGSLGILLNIGYLQGFSLTTNEYVTLLWALGIYLALLIARSGFNQVDYTIKSLRSGKDELEKLNRLKDVFTDIMRHDLLNPVGMIKSYLELLYEEPLEPVAKEYVDIISNSAERASEMIESASKLAKLESEERLELTDQDLGRILASSVNDHRMIAEKKGISLEMMSKGEFIAPVNNVVYEVFSNIISNAIKYSPQGSKIEVGIEDDDGFWRVSVKDQGEGIPDEFKKDIFDRFTRIHKGGVEGTGLGLTIVKKIVDMHRGKVWVENNLGGGSIFYVNLPKKL